MMDRERLDKFDKKTHTPPEKIDSWKEYFEDFCERHAVAVDNAQSAYNESQKNHYAQQLSDLEKKRAYLQHIRERLDSMGAKTSKEVYGDTAEGKMLPTSNRRLRRQETTKPQPRPRYMFLSNAYWGACVPEDQSELYDELFEAAFRGDNVKIEELCVPSDGGEDVLVIPVQITVQAMMPRNMRSGVSFQYCSPAHH